VTTGNRLNTRAPNTAAMYKILTLYAGQQPYDVHIPFACQRCARCCQQLGIDLSAIDKQQVSDYLGLDWTQIEALYLRKRGQGSSPNPHKWIRRSSPCPFVSSQGSCTIYPVRPNGCRSYPVYTLLGPEAVDCPGMEFMQRVVSILGRGIPYELHFPGRERGRAPSEATARRMLEKLDKAGLPRRIISELIRMNRWATVSTS
jgi:Fe-S-cluster containining protein